MKVTDTNKKNEVHIIFFHGIGDNYKRAQQTTEDLYKSIEYSCTSNELKVTAHKYPNAFQSYITYFTISCLFFGASILAPIIIIACSQSIMMIGLASLAALMCIFLSVAFLIVPFISGSQNLSKSSIEQINQLVKDGVKSENIILFGHSFGGAVASAVLKHFTDKKIKLRGVVFTSTFSSFHTAIKHFPIPQTKILSILPSYLLTKMLKALDLDFDIVNDIQKLQNDGELGMPITIINHAKDELIPQPAQLAYAIENNKSMHERWITLVDLNESKRKCHPHNGVLDSPALTKGLREVVLNRIGKERNR